MVLLLKVVISTALGGLSSLGYPWNVPLCLWVGYLSVSGDQ